MGSLVPINKIYDKFMISDRHLQLYFGTLEKMAKLLVIYGAIPPRV